MAKDSVLIGKFLENLPIYIFPRYIFLGHRNTALSLAEQKSFWARLKAGDEGF